MVTIGLVAWYLYTCVRNRRQARAGPKRLFGAGHHPLPEALDAAAAHEYLAQPLQTDGGSGGGRASASYGYGAVRSAGGAGVRSPLLPSGSAPASSSPAWAIPGAGGGAALAMQRASGSGGQAAGVTATEDSGAGAPRHSYRNSATNISVFKPAAEKGASDRDKKDAFVVGTL